jgi:3-methyladenine DNA glycosylase/8-oxoguanine DNA glycosylase
MPIEELALRAELCLPVHGPLAFDATFFKPDHFPAPDSAWQPGLRRQAMRWGGRALGLCYRPVEMAGEGKGAPRVAVQVWAAAPLAAGELAALAGELIYRHNLSLDLAPFYTQVAADPQLGPAITRWRGMRPACFSSLYEYLIIAIVLQNATVRRTAQMMAALVEHYGTPIIFDGATLSCLPGPEMLAAAGEAELRALKLGYRARALTRVSAVFAGGEIDELALRAASYDTQRRQLLALYGVGPASVGYILFDLFHHLDELAHISPWEQRIYSRLLLGCPVDAPAPVAELRDLLTARYGIYRMLAVHYLWEDLFWQRRQGAVQWLEPLIRL